MDTLAFAERFEAAGFAAMQARALASAMGDTHDATVEAVVTKDHLDLRLAEMDMRLTKQMAEMEMRLTKQVADMVARWTKQLAEMDSRWTRQIADNGKDISARLWFTIAIIAGVSTAISATIGAAMVVLLKSGGL